MYYQLMRNTKMAALIAAVRGSKRAHPPKTPTLDLCKVFSPAADESSDGDKSNGVGAAGPGEGPASCFS